MTKEHQRRYEQAIARITPERRDRIAARVLKELGLNAYPTDVFLIQKVDALIAHKLGIRSDR